MNNLVKIENQEIQVKEFNGQRVVTFKDIDRVHERARGTAKRNFNENKQRLIEGVDYFFVNQKDVGANFVQTYGFDNRAPSGALITETGYLMIVKSLRDDLAWKVQRQLVNCYFKVKEETEVNSTHKPSITFEQTLEIAKAVSKTPLYAMEHVFKVLKIFVPELEMPEPEPRALQGVKVVKYDLEFQKQLNKYLKENNLTICEFSRRSGLPKSNIWNWVNGKATPSMSNLRIIANIIGSDVNIFL